MKKISHYSQIEAIALFLLVSFTPLRACGPWIFGPGDISIYRIMPYWQEKDYTAQRSDFVSANCHLWAEQVALPNRMSTLPSIRPTIASGKSFLPIMYLHCSPTTKPNFCMPSVHTSV